MLGVQGGAILHGVVQYYMGWCDILGARSQGDAQDKGHAKLGTYME